ncbi:MAG TPA: hypothetical protein VGF06_08080 [Terriglobales bacterium]|jgi:hypothetical protein
MKHDPADLLELLEFELKFIEDGGYGRSPHAPWRAPWIFEDSPICLNFDDATRPHPCTDCALMAYVPPERRDETVPCRAIPINAHGQTIENFYQYGTQIELEEALKNWLRKEIARLKTQAGTAKVSV